jgi:endonuclease YncB( thermonuclease family)
MAKHVFRLSILAAASAPLLLQHSIAFGADDILWPQQPIKIDRSKQTYERLPALQKEIDKRTWFVVPQRINVIDSARFTIVGKSFRIDLIHPVDGKRICHDIDGSRWTCGRMAVILLGNLVRGKKLLCNAIPGEKETVLRNCQSGVKDVASEIIASGLGKTDAEGLQSTQQLARKKRAGLWRNPDCTVDFDHC